LNGLVAKGRCPHIARNANASAAVRDDCLRRFVRVARFHWEAAQRDVGAFARKEDGHCASYARIPAGNQRHAPLEFPGRPIGRRSEPRTRLHVRLDTGATLMLGRGSLPGGWHGDLIDG
jgi:hypothetical protein